MQLAVPIPLEPELHGPAGGREGGKHPPPAFAHGRRVRSRLPAQPGWVRVLLKALLHPCMPQMLGELQSPKQIKNCETRLLIYRLIATSTHEWAPRKGQVHPPPSSNTHTVLVQRHPDAGIQILHTPPPPPPRLRATPPTRHSVSAVTHSPAKRDRPCLA